MLKFRGAGLGATIATAAFAFCLVSAAFAARAEAYVYWTNDNGTIGRANLDGTNVNQALITGPSGPRGIAVDGSHVYWADDVMDTIGRANLDGTNVDENFISATNPFGVEVDAGHIYWTNGILAGPDTIGRANLDGTGVNQSFIPTGNVNFGVAVNASHIYWANYSTDAIGRATLDGTGVTQTLFATGGTPQGIAVDAGNVYWANYDDPGGTAIGRANLDGSSANSSFIAGATNPYGIAVDTNSIYWVDHDNETISRATRDGGTITPSLISAIEPWGVAVDALPLPPVPPDTDPPETEITRAPANKSGKPKAKYKFEADEPDSTFECKLKGKGLAKSVKKFGDCDSPRKYKGLNEGKLKFQVRAVDTAGNVDPSPAEDKFKVVG